MLGGALGPVVRSVRRLVAFATWRRRRATHDFLGEPLHVTIADSTARDWYENSLPSPSEMHMLRERGLLSGALAFNLGAHQAVIAVMLSRLVGPRGHIIAVEPDPHSHKIALANRNLNQASNVTVLHAVASDTSGVTRFGLALGSSGSVALAEAGAHPTVAVRSVTVDELAAEHGWPDLVYIDVEGFEQKVLMGAAQTLAQHAASWIVEVHVGVGLEASGGTAAGVLSYFPPDQYEVYVKHPDPNRRDELVPLESLGRDLDYHCNIVAVPRRLAATPSGVT